MTAPSFILSALLAVSPLFSGGWPWSVRAAVCAVAAGGWAHLFFSPREGVLVPSRRFFWPAAVFFAAALPPLFRETFLHSTDRAFSSEAAGLFIFLCAASLPRGKSAVSSGAAAGLVFVSAWGGWEAVRGLFSGGGAPSGPFPNANVLASHVLLTAPLTAVFLGERFRRAALVVALSMGLLLLATHSRAAAAVALWEGVFLYALFSGRHWRWFFLLTGALAGGALRGLDADRLSWGRSAWGMFRDAPWLGVGPGVFGEAFPLYRADALRQNTLFAHNIFLEILAERGVVGTGAFLIFTGVFFHGVFRRRDDASAPEKAAWVGIAGFMTYNLLHVGFSFPAPAWTFWALCGAFLPGAARAPGKGPVRWAGLAAAVPCVLFGLWRNAVDGAVDRVRHRMEKGDFEAAAGLLSAFPLGGESRAPEVWSLRAALAAADGRWEEAGMFIGRAVEIAPGSARFRAEAGEICWRRGDRAAALAHTQRACALLPLNAAYRARVKEMSDAR